MKRSLLIATLLLAPCAPAAGAERATQSATPRLLQPLPRRSAPAGSRSRFRRCRPFKPQQPKRIELANGMVVFLSRKPRTAVDLRPAMIRGGSDCRARSEDRPGGNLRRELAHRRHGKADRRPARRLPRSPRRQGGNRGCSRLDDHQLQLSEGRLRRCLRRLRRPAAPSGLPRREARAGQAADGQRHHPPQRRDRGDRQPRSRTFSPTAQENPYAREPEYATVAAVTREDLLDWHKQHSSPTTSSSASSATSIPRRWKRRCARPSSPGPKAPKAIEPDIKFTDPKPGYYLVDKSDVNQSRSHGCPRHCAPQSRLLRRVGDE